MALSCALWTGVAIADGGKPAADCDCRARGQKWSQGDEICLSGTLHRCGMSLNVTSWLDTGRPCPQTLLGTPLVVRLPAPYAEAAFSSLSE